MVFILQHFVNLKYINIHVSTILFFFSVDLEIYEFSDCLPNPINPKMAISLILQFFFI